MAVKKIPDGISSIRELLAENPEGLTIISISELLGMNRNSAAVSLKLLQMQGRVTLKQVGPAKIYCPAKKLPVGAVMKLSNNGVLVFCKGETVVDMNEPLRELLHAEKHDLIGKTTRQLPFFAGSPPELPGLIRDALKGKETMISAELALTDSSMPCRLRICPVFFEDGEPGVALIAETPEVAANHDRTDHAIEDSLAELDVTEYICRFLPDGTLTYVNRAYSHLLHKTKAELIGHTWRPTVPASEYKKIKKCLLSLDSAHPVASLEFKAITPSGDSRWQKWKFRILPDWHGQPGGYMGTGMDITDLKKSEAKARKSSEELESLLQEREDEFQDLNRQIYDEIASHEKTNSQFQFTQFAMDKASYMITWISREGRFVYMNREARQVLGYQYRDVGTKKIQDIIAGFFQFPWDEIWDTIKRDRNYTVETTLVTNMGSEVPVEMVFNYLLFKDKEYCCCFAKDITMQKQAEIALRETNEYLNNLFDYANAPIIVWDPEFVITRFNHAFGDLTIRSEQEVIGQPLHILFPEDSREKSLLQIKKTLKGERWEAVEIPILVKDGSIRTVLWNSANIKDTDGRIISTIAQGVDITERKLAEEALRASRDKLTRSEADLHGYQAELEMQAEELRKAQLLLGESRDKYLDLYEFAPIGYLTLTKKALITDVNLTGTNLIGVERNKLVNSQFRKFISPADYERWQRYFNDVLDSKEKQVCTITIRRGDGSVFPARLEGARTTGSNGAITARIAISDITDIRMTEKALRETNEYLNNLFDYANAPIIVWDPGFFITRFNHAFEDLTSRSVEEVIGQRLSILFPEDSRDTSLLQIKKTLEGERWEAVEIPILVKDGSTRTVLWNSANIRDTDGRIIYTIAQGVDITGRKLAEEALQKKETSFHAIFDNHDSIMLIVEQETGNIIEANLAAERFYGRSRTELCTLSIDDINTLPPGELALLRAKVARGQVSSFTTRHRLLNGDVRTVAVHSSPVTMGEKTVLFSIIHEIASRETGGRDVQ